MANSGYIHADGELMYVRVDPSAGTLVQPGTIDNDEIANISITASGGTVTVKEVRFPKKYPFVDLVGNQWKCCFLLSRRIKPAETVSVDLPASLFSDGVINSPAVSSLSLTNKSLAAQSLADLIDSDHITNTTKLYYLDTANGDDTNAALVKSGDGYYRTTDYPDPKNPSGETAYATLGAIATELSASDNAVILIKDTSLAGATHFMSSGQMMGAKSGTSRTAPLIVCPYGGTSRVTLTPGSTNGNRAFNLSGDRANWIFIDIDFQTGTGVNSIRMLAPNTAGDYGNLGFIRCSIENIDLGATTANDGSRTRSNMAFIDCVFDNASDASGLQGVRDYNDFMYREISFSRCLFKNLGSSALEHALYPKNFVDFSVYRCVFYNNSGTGIKTDMCWGADITNCIYVEMATMLNIESNGDDVGAPATFFPNNRNRESQTTETPVIASADGTYNKWCTARRLILTNVSASASLAGIIGRYGTSYDCQVKDCLAVNMSDVLTNGCVFAAQGGSDDYGGFTRDSESLDYANCTLVAAGTTTKNAFGITVNAPTSDTFSATNDLTKGHHSFTITRSIVYFGSGLTGTTVGAIRIDNDEYDDAYTLGRLDGTFTSNNVYRASGSQTNLYDDGANEYSTISAFETALNASVSTITGTRFEDPGFPDVGYQVSDYAEAISGSLENFIEALADRLLSNSVTIFYEVENIANDVLPKYSPDSLSASDYGSTLPGFASWATGDAVLPLTGTRGGRGVRATRAVR